MDAQLRMVVTKASSRAPLSICWVRQSMVLMLQVSVLRVARACCSFLCQEVVRVAPQEGQASAHTILAGSWAILTAMNAMCTMNVLLHAHPHPPSPALPCLVETPHVEDSM